MGDMTINQSLHYYY